MNDLTKLHKSDIPTAIMDTFKRGCAIPAQPLALDEDRQFNHQHQRALTRYYIDAGVGGIAVGVHSTQFEIRDPGIDLFEPVLELASETIDDYCAQNDTQILKIAGVCGKTEQALAEATFAVGQGYHACLLSLAAFADSDIDEIIAHCQRISEVMPLIGFYLQPSVGGRILPYEFWRKFAEIDNVIGIKMAPFNRYQTFDVVRAVCEAGRADDVTLYTGNDDNIVVDLLSEYTIQCSNGQAVSVRIRGGLLGHFCVWTRSAVALLEEIHVITEKNADVPQALLTKNIEVTDMNAVIFDVANSFHGCIPGIHEVLVRQGLLLGTWCLNPQEVLSAGQADEITRVCRAYPHLIDDAFVAQNLSRWLAD